MPSLKDLTALTSRLDQLAAELHAELNEGAIDFRKMVELADDIGEHSDRLATAFTTMANALDQSLDDNGADASDRDGEGQASGGEQDSA